MTARLPEFQSRLRVALGKLLILPGLFPRVRNGGNNIIYFYGCVLRIKLGKLWSQHTLH